MEIKVELTEQDYIKFYKAYGLERNWLRKSLIILLIGLVVLLWTQGDRSIVNWPLFMIRLLIICIILVPVFFVIPYLLERAKLKKIYEQARNPLGVKIYKPYSTGIEVIGNGENIFIKMDEIKKPGKAGAFIYLLLKSGDYHLLPLRFFASADDAARFLSIIPSVAAAPKGSFWRQPQFRPVYLVGLMCFVPGFGVVIAIVLIVLGISQYKDPIVITIGILGIAWTVGFFKYTMDQAQNTPEFKKAMAMASTMQLNGLVKEIEFYKLQKGAYPDSLGTLSSKDNTVFTDDPIQSFKNSGRQSEFNYKKIGKKYLLFSSGADGIAGTEDDLYPTLTDTAKLGFIRKR